jgi:hypothetical protein
MLASGVGHREDQVLHAQSISLTIARSTEMAMRRSMVVPFVGCVS